MRETPGRRVDWLIRGDGSPEEPSSPNWLNRLIRSLNFIVVIIFLGAWITAFLLLKQYALTSALPQNVTTDLTCLSFFGGLIVAFLIAAITGNLLHRFL